MKINGRLLLLAVVTGLFMRIWSETGARHAADQLSKVQPAPVTVSLPISGDESSAHGSPSDSQLTAALPAFDPSVQPQEWTPATAPILLPQGLSAGTWRVVDDTGRVARLELPVGDFPVDQLQAEFHATTIDGQRWYFIRLSSPERIASGRPVLEAASTPAPQPASDEPPVLVDAGNPGSPLAGGEVVVALESVPASGAGPETPPSDPTDQVDASTELPPVPVMAEPLHAPPALSERPLQAQAEIPAENLPEAAAEPILETSGGITNRKFDFAGYGVAEPERATPAAVDVTATERVAPPVFEPKAADPRLAELGPERPAEVDMPEGA
jgi:hypothetical protein